jgi:hypothetical protein
VSVFDARREVAEIAVVDGVPDIAAFIIKVEVWHPGGGRHKRHLEPRAATRNAEPKM